jgi:hypothetical protein
MRAAAFAASAALAIVALWYVQMCKSLAQYRSSNGFYNCHFSNRRSPVDACSLGSRCQHQTHRRRHQTHLRQSSHLVGNGVVYIIVLISVSVKICVKLHIVSVQVGRSKRSCCFHSETLYVCSRYARYFVVVLSTTSGKARGPTASSMLHCAIYY